MGIMDSVSGITTRVSDKVDEIKDDFENKMENAKRSRGRVWSIE